MPLHKYEEQSERVKRWHEKFRQIDEGTSHDFAPSTEYYHDQVFAFFLNCYHLKDWIKNDESLPKNARDTVEGFVEKTKYLFVCRDICNSIKHLVLKNPPRSGAQGGRRLFKATVGDKTSMAVKCSIVRS